MNSTQEPAIEQLNSVSAAVSTQEQSIVSNKRSLDDDTVESSLKRRRLSPTGGENSVTSETILELMIPAGKVGRVIGTSGKTIKRLQNQAGVRMKMIQNGKQQTTEDKLLRIMGETQNCENAKQLVLDFIADKRFQNDFNINKQTPRGFHANGSDSQQRTSVVVPNQAVGVVIGKGGEMLKKIRQNSGANVQFLPENGSGNRICLLTGDSNQTQKAQIIIYDLINSKLLRDQNHQSFAGRGNSGRGRSGKFDGPGSKTEYKHSVPAARCGIIIGKGGESIKQINQLTGAYASLSRQPSTNPDEKVFTIRGSQQQIEYAVRLINEKAGVECVPTAEGTIELGEDYGQARQYVNAQDLQQVQQYSNAQDFQQVLQYGDAQDLQHLQVPYDLYALQNSTILPNQYGNSQYVAQQNPGYSYNVYTQQ